MICAVQKRVIIAALHKEIHPSDDMMFVHAPETVSRAEYFPDLCGIGHTGVNVGHFLVVFHNRNHFRRPKPKTYRFRYDRVYTDPVIIIQPSLR